MAEYAPFDAPAGTVAEAEKRAHFALDDRLPGCLHEPLVRREDEPDASTREALPGGRGGAGEMVGSPPGTSV